MNKSRNSFWTVGQIRFLESNYPDKGDKWCSENMPGAYHSAESIRWKCSQLGIRRRDDWRQQA